MKANVVFMLLAVAPVMHAQWVVLDAANLSQNVTNYAAMVEQLARQAQQISNQVHQIQQMEDSLKRLGNMADIKSVVGFPEFKMDLDLPTKVTTWAEGGIQADGRKIFGDSRGGVFQPVAAEFPDFDGGAIVRDDEAYKSAEEITRKVDEFKEVQADVLTRREALKRAIGQTSEALQAAQTEAEETKLQAVLNAQYSQLAAVDSEVALSAAEIQVRAAESGAMTNARREADAEARRKLAQQEGQKIGHTFKPIYDSILLYVKERPFQP